MKKNTIKFYSIVENLVPEYVKEEFPLVVEFLSQYYKSQENQSSALDIIHNIDKYVQIDNVTELNLKTSLIYPLDFGSEIFVYSTYGFPENYGLIKIDDEIILYEKLVSTDYEEAEFEINVGSNSIISSGIKSEWIGKILIVKDSNGNTISTNKIVDIEDGLDIILDSVPITSNTITGYNSLNKYTCEINGNKLINCTRGFSSVTAYDTDTTIDELFYEETTINTHSLGSEVKNLSIIFLTEFLKKIKFQLTPGFEDEEFYDKINEATFIRNIKQFYSSKGTDCSFELLFRALFGEDINIIRPRDFLIQPSDAQYDIFRDLVVESLSGNPEDLENLTLYQDEYLNIPEARGTVAKVEKIQRGDQFYYIISLDLSKETNYDSNLGKFTIHPKTKTTNKIISASDFIDVDSTVGFPDSGEIEVKISKDQSFVVSYASKTSTQFLDCVGIYQDIDINTTIKLNTYAYGYNGSDEIRVNVTGVLSSVNINSSPYYSSTSETIKIECPGANVKDIRAENWFYNISTLYDIKNINLLITNSNFTYEIDLYDENILKIGDSVSLLYSQGEIKNGIVIGVNNLKSYIVTGFGNINLNIKYKLRKNISKVNSLNYQELSKYSTNVQNVYIDSDENIFVNSQSLPNYLDEPLLIRNRSVEVSGSYVNSEIININSHGFYTGDSVVYYPNENGNDLDIKKGIYFVSVVDSNNIKIARSRENIFTNNFIKVTGNPLKNKFILTSFTDNSLSEKKLLPQNIFRKISLPTIEPNNVETKPGTTGIFLNGVELLNYKSEDIISYGEIETIYPVSSGSGYDIINPPQLQITDLNGSGASGYVSIKGSLDRIDIISPGFDYLETPNIIIKGGNGFDAKASVNLISIDHLSGFNAKTGVNTVTNIIGFSTYHKFRNNEIVYYDPKNQTPISGLSTNSSYYVSVIDPFNVKLYLNFNDASAGINTVNLTGIGTGRQFLKSFLKKKVIGSIQIVDNGFGYETKKRTSSSIGISTFKNSIFIENHGYLSGEIIKYESTQTNIGGLVSGTSYYVTKLNNNEFKLSNVALGTTQKDFFYSTKQYIDFTSSGVGTHIFNYEPISIEVIGVSGIGSTHFEPVNLNPIFTGRIESVHLENKGQSYGSNIINFNRQPNVELLTGKNAQVSPVIKDGKIVDIIIQNGGSEYYSTPKIQIIGKGSGALLTPIIENNKLTKVKIISSGGGYDNGTIVNVISSGLGSKFESKIRTWTINLFERLFRNNQIPPDDGIIYGGKNNKNGLEYTHLYPARKLRSSVLGKRSLNGEIVYNVDLELINGTESTSLTHSPIIGWAYDGNPIYGPYGYFSITGGSVKQMKSGYELKNNLTNRPNYPLGIFVEDYEFTSNGDLDKHNGRFCVTPEFPNGVYAYFSTFDLGLPQSTPPFLNYKKPEFPYVIGNSYRSKQIDFNFLSTSNLNKFNLNDSSLLRNTRPYGILNENSYYDYFDDPNKIKKQISKIKSVSSGSIKSIGVTTGGTGYSIGDEVILSDNKSKVFVSQLKGVPVKNISNLNTTIFDVEFINDDGVFVGFCTTPHGLLSNDLISITSTYENNISSKVLVDSHSLTVNSGIESSSVTGIVTYIDVLGSLNPSKIRENDIYFLGNEQIKILNIDYSQSRLRILRNQNGTVGLSSISVGTAITESPRKFSSYFKVSRNYSSKYNKEIYFEPQLNVGIGTSFGVGITTTLFLSVNNNNHPVSIGTGSTTFLYFKDLKDIQNYSSGGYVDIVNSSNSSFNTTKKKIVSIGLTAIGIDFNTSALSGLGVTSYVNGWNIENIPTKSVYLPNHGFETGDLLTYNTNGGSSIGFSTNGLSSFTLTENDNLFVVKLSNDLIGLSTFKVGINSVGEYVGIETTSKGILYFTSVGTGNTHSFTTNYTNILKANISKNTVTVETKENHNLNRGDIVSVSVTPKNVTTVVVKYNKKHRKLIIDPFDFISSNVNLTDNTITINNHKLKTGQKVIHTSNSPVGGLLDNEIYYVTVVDENTIKLSETYYDVFSLDPQYVNLTSLSNGTISKINPPINVIKNSELYFDLSDPSLSFNKNPQSYSAFRLDFYEDSKFTVEYQNSKVNSAFDVKRYGSVGIDTGAYTLLKTTNISQNLYYKLVPIDLKNNDIENIQISEDDDVTNNNQIILSSSLYNGQYFVSGIGSTSFTFITKSIPELSSYNLNNSVIEYFIDNSSISGPISSVSVKSTDNNITSLPKIDSIKTFSGKDAILYVEGEDIGKIINKNIEITDIGFNYSSDFSLRPTAKFSSLFEIDSFSTIENVLVTSSGRNYSVKPDLILYDSINNNIIDDIILEYDIRSNKVDIIKNTNNITDYVPTLVAINNSNGVGINSISYNLSTKTVTVGIAKSYSFGRDFPFQIGDNIFVENISVGIGSTSKGYNSSEYGYKTFEIVSIDPNIGGTGGTVTYSMSDLLENGDVLGTYDPINSSGRIINENDLPKFEVLTKKKTFFANEVIQSQNAKGIVEYHDKNRNIIKVSSDGDFSVGDKFKGLSSNSIGIIKNITEFKLNYNVSESSIVTKGWQKETGFLNYNTQRIHDSDYYQYFSYSVQSKVSYEKWDESVSKLTHTSGFKKFSDLIVDSTSNYSGMSKEQTGSNISAISDIHEVVNLNCYPDFDLVKENNVIIDSKYGSNEITFNSKIIQDYIESIGNRVLEIDDISTQFNSNPRNETFTVVDEFSRESTRFKKYFFSVQDKVILDDLEVGLITLVQDGSNAYLNQYGFTSIINSLGSFDFSISSGVAQLKYYPYKYSENSYEINFLSFNLPNIVSGIGSTSVGNIVNISSNYTNVSSATTTTILTLPLTYRSSKVIVQIGKTDNSYYEINELTVQHDGTNVDFLEYGLLKTGYLDSYSNGVGIGNYNVSISGPNLIIELDPIVGYGSTINVNTFAISISDSSLSGIGTNEFFTGSVNSRFTSISSSPTPTPQVISQFDIDSLGSYYVASIEDTTNNRYQTSEILVVGNGSTSYVTEFGTIYSDQNLGTFSSDISGSNNRLLFKPLPNINVQVRVSEFLTSLPDDLKTSELDLENDSSIYFGNSEYVGTQLDIKKSFDLTHKQTPIFQRTFSGISSSVVDVSSDTIEIPNHFFVTGEEIKYSYLNSDTSTANAIGIATTTITGIGTTSKLPSTLYIVKVNDIKVKVAASASEALSTIPKVLNLTSVGVGTNHVFTSKKQNTKCLITIDNVIQSPIVSTSVTTGLSTSLLKTSSFVNVINQDNFIGGDFIKVNDEIMKIRSVGFGTVGRLLVQRGLLGTEIKNHNTSDPVVKILGNYNIVNNTINFSEAPYGAVPILNPNTRPDEEDYFGIKISSSFNGRVFLRSGIENSIYDPYKTNYIFDDVSNNFTGITTQFNITSDQSNVSGISTSNAIVLVNNILQFPSSNIDNNQYDLSENSGITTISFMGSTSSDYNYDINLTNLPRGGIILSVGSSSGFGYQPLVSAAGTAIVSSAGTIQSISIGNSGSGYRSGIQTTINVGVTTSSLDNPNIHFIGTATVSNGRIVSIAITNPGIGYTSSNPPLVIFDSPLSYYNLPLVYSSGSSGVGTGGMINVVVGQGSSVINFEITNYGFGYKIGDILTINSGGISGIPTNTSLSFSEFKITVNDVYEDSFSGWSIGDLQIIDSIEEFIDGKRTIFPIRINGQQISIRSRKGSNINISLTLLVFVNNVLQTPNNGYIFNGGSVIQLLEPPKENDDVKILFYKGTGDVDVKNVDILEPIEIGDIVNINSSEQILDEDERLVEQIVNSDVLYTNSYFGVGISSNTTLNRPITLCKQTEDRFINGNYVAKTRVQYEPLIFPTTNIIQNVSTSSTTIFVESVKTFFDSGKEYNQDNVDNIPQKSIRIISQNSIVAASATALVSTAGTISSILISNGGVGYTTSPSIVIQNPVGYGFTVGIGTTSLVSASISVGGTVSSIVVTNPGSGYTSSNPPIVIIEPPTIVYEDITNVSYTGDYGIIVGISTTSIVGVASTGIVFDLFIPPLSYVRDSTINVGITTTIGTSGIQTGYLFVVSNSNIGNGVTALNSSGSIVGIGSTFLDNIYSAVSVSVAQTSVPGIGVTSVSRVVVSVRNYNGLTGIGNSEFFGNYSWGRISNMTRKNPKSFTANINGYSGISSSPIVIRNNPLKYIGYSTT